MTPGLIRNSHCFFMSLNLPLVKWRISLGHPRTPPVPVLLISRHPSAGGVKVLNYPPLPQFSQFLQSHAISALFLGPHEYSTVSSHGTAARAGKFSQVQSSTIK